ncbi:hypothetical protein GCM10023188_04550 [Pontibacter saemangeumensis]|uniref:Lipid/polyisoprenoid-binding YceI-like domain-containing protein n=1 Tax=Pontibacter saemangeumensis TaxID=1084525 RepID=A0ABP8L943_9BACT
MKTIALLLLSLLMLTGEVAAQNRYFTKTGYIWFFSKAPLEDIEAHNRKVVSFIDLATGEMAFSVPMKEFGFRKSLMQQHFNENFVESEKYPKATFAGRYTNPTQVDLTKNAAYNVLVEGVLTIHGVDKKISAPGTLVVKNGSVQGKSEFVVAPKDFDIRIPLLVREHIAKEITIYVDMLYQPYTRDNP